MGWILLLILIGWPVVEIVVFVQVGAAIGLLNTILLFLVAGAAGLWLLRAEGISLLIRAQQQMNQGIVPVREGFDALCLVISGMLLILPGFVTDVVALLLILPPVRGALRRLLVRWVDVRTEHARTKRGLVIEADYEDVTPSPGERPDKIVRRPD